MPQLIKQNTKQWCRRSHYSLTHGIWTKWHLNQWVLYISYFAYYRQCLTGWITAHKPFLSPSHMALKLWVKDFWIHRTIQKKMFKVCQSFFFLINKKKTSHKPTSLKWILRNRLYKEKLKIAGICECVYTPTIYTQKYTAPQTISNH